MIKKTFVFLLISFFSLGYSLNSSFVASAQETTETTETTEASETTSDQTSATTETTTAETTTDTATETATTETATEEVTATETTATETIATETEAEAEETEVSSEDAGILPTSSFYFLKTWKWGVQRTFTFNPVKKAELELKITNQQASEIKKMEETTPNRLDAISKATKNYSANVDRLKTKLEGLKEEGKNPNVDKLLGKLADRSVKHQALFDKLEKKFEGKDNLGEQFREAKKKFGEAINEIPTELENKENFEKRVEKAKEKIEKGIEDGKITKESVETMISNVRDMISKAESALATSTAEVSEKVNDVIKKVNDKLTKAETALSEGKIGEAFGQVTAAKNEIMRIIKAKPLPTNNSGVSSTSTLNR